MSERYTYRAVYADGGNVEGKIEEQNFSGTTRRSPDSSSLVEVGSVAEAACKRSGRETHVLRDDNTVAQVYRP